MHLKHLVELYYPTLLRGFFAMLCCVNSFRREELAKMCLDSTIREELVLAHYSRENKDWTKLKKKKVHVYKKKKKKKKKVK